MPVTRRQTPDGSTPVIRPVEMPARKVPFTRLTKIVVAKLPAEDS
jgi:hypothetical protein